LRIRLLRPRESRARQTDAAADSFLELDGGGWQVTLSPGARLGPYEIVASIGAGGMGEVFTISDFGFRISDLGS